MTRQDPLSTGFPRQKSRSGCNFLLQGIFPIQESNTCFLYCRRILDNLSHQRSPQLRRRGREKRSLVEAAFGRKPGIGLVPRSTEGRGRWSRSEPLPRPGPALRTHTPPPFPAVGRPPSAFRLAGKPPPDTRPYEAPHGSPGVSRESVLRPCL